MVTNDHNNFIGCRAKQDAAHSKIAYGSVAHCLDDRKKGDFSELYVYRFRIQNQLYLLG